MTVDWKSYWDTHAAQAADADPLKQVLRVQNKKPISQASFQDVCNNILEHLKLNSGQQVLDLCCGNGLISEVLASQCRSVTAVDFCSSLVDEIPRRSAPNINTVLSDALDVDFDSKSYDAALLAAALQHFSQAQVVRLLSSLYDWLRPGGRLLITDIPDLQCIWRFYNTPERQQAYFINLERETPIIGTWFERGWLEKLAQVKGFTSAEAIDQPRSSPYAHYRFDLLCTK